jgi:hypothetical protein
LVCPEQQLLLQMENGNTRIISLANQPKQSFLNVTGKKMTFHQLIENKTNDRLIALEHWHRLICHHVHGFNNYRFKAVFFVNCRHLSVC